ncbi:MAG: universal stress protein [Halorientalis sp.]
MQRALVVLDESEEHRALLREAGELAAGVGAELVLLTTLTPDEYAEDAAKIDQIAQVEHTGYDDDTVVDAVRRFARELAEEEISDLDVEYSVVGEVVDEDEHADAILETAENEGCDHVFITGRRRSPTGKAIFGDAAQRVILNFDGSVTVRTS